MSSGDTVLVDLLGETLSMHMDGEWEDANLYMPFLRESHLIHILGLGYIFRFIE